MRAGGALRGASQAARGLQVAGGRALARKRVATVGRRLADPGVGWGTAVVTAGTRARCMAMGRGSARRSWEALAAAARQHAGADARCGQNGQKVGSFDGG